MRLSSEHRQFLESVAQQNDRANHIDIAGQRRCLVHSFWTIDEILSGLALRSEWDVPDVSIDVREQRSKYMTSHNAVNTLKKYGLLTWIDWFVQSRVLITFYLCCD